MSRTRERYEAYPTGYCPECNLADPPVEGHVCDEYRTRVQGLGRSRLVKLKTHHWYPEEVLDLCDEPIELLDLQTATRNALLLVDIITIGDLLLRTPRDMMRVSRIGKGRLHEIEWNMADFGVHLVWETSRCLHRNCNPCFLRFGPYPPGRRITT